MECSCTVSIDHDGGPSCCKEVIRTARKTHRCCECLSDINPGDHYEYISGIWDGDPQTYKTCLDCKSVKDVFFDSWTYTQVWDDFYSNFYPDNIPEKCIAALTPNSRAKICQWIENSLENDED